MKPAKKCLRTSSILAALVGQDLCEEGLLVASRKCGGVDELIQLASDRVDLSEGRDGRCGHGHPEQQNPGKEPPGVPHDENAAVAGGIGVSQRVQDALPGLVESAVCAMGASDGGGKLGRCPDTPKPSTLNQDTLTNVKRKDRRWEALSGCSRCSSLVFLLYCPLQRSSPSPFMYRIHPSMDATGKIFLTPQKWPILLKLRD